MSFRLEDLPPFYRAQAEAQLAIADAREKRRVAASIPEIPDNSAKKKKPKRIDGFDSEWEARYDRHLAARYAAGEIARYFFHGIKLGDPASWYTPDFIIIPHTGKWIIHEVKAHWRSRDRRIWNQVRLKYAAEFEFGVVRYEGGKLVIREDWTNP